jgi:hypothetical protein
LRTFLVSEFVTVCSLVNFVHLQYLTTPSFSRTHINKALLYMVRRPELDDLLEDYIDKSTEEKLANHGLGISWSVVEQLKNLWVMSENRFNNFKKASSNGCWVESLKAMLGLQNFKFDAVGDTIDDTHVLVYNRFILPFHLRRM